MAELPTVTVAKARIVPIRMRVGQSRIGRVIDPAVIVARAYSSCGRSFPLVNGDAYER